MTKYTQPEDHTPQEAAQVIQEAVLNEEWSGYVPGTNVKWDANDKFWEPTFIELYIFVHESQMDTPFEFYGSSQSKSFHPHAERKRYTTIVNLSEEAGRYADYLSMVFDTEWEFAQLEPGSYGSDGMMTDYEFKYEAIAQVGDIKDANL